MLDRCENCTFFKSGNKCRRLPPVVFYDIHQCKAVTAYPHVNHTMWCGEHKPRRRTSALVVFLGVIKTLARRKKL